MAICGNCGGWTEPPVLVGAGAATVEVVCPHCRHREPFPQYPLWWIAGSSGSGKSTLAPLLRRRLPECIVFEGEAIDYWRFKGDAGDYAALYDQWLKVAAEIAANGYPVVFLGIAYPEQLAACPMRSRFNPIHYLGLVCAAEEQARRLRARPAWRDSTAPAFIEWACAFSRRLGDAAASDEQDITVVDTTNTAPDETAAAIAAWVRGNQ